MTIAVMLVCMEKYRLVVATVKEIFRKNDIRISVVVVLYRATSGYHARGITALTSIRMHRMLYSSRRLYQILS